MTSTLRQAQLWRPSSPTPDCDGARIGDVISCHRAHQIRVWGNGGPGTVGFQVSEHCSEKLSVIVNSQHLSGKLVHYSATTSPERAALWLDEKRSEGIRDLVTHVRVAHVEAGKHNALDLEHAGDGLVQHLATQHVHEHNTRRHNEGNVLPPLHNQGAVDPAEPGGDVPWLEVSNPITSLTDEMS